MTKQYLLQEVGEPSVSKFEFYLDDDSCKDITFQNAVLFLKIFDAFKLLRKSLRSHNGNGYYEPFNAVRKFFYPFLYAFGFSTYGPLSMWDQKRTDFRCHEKVRRLIKAILSYKGQGRDFAQEQSIQVKCIYYIYVYVLLISIHT